MLPSSRRVVGPMVKLLFLVSLLLTLAHSGFVDWKQRGRNGLQYIDGCPAEEVGSSCVRMNVDAQYRANCPHKMWRSYLKLVYHVPSKTTSVTTIWQEIRALIPGHNYRWNYTQTDGKEFQFGDGEKVVCSKNKPVISLAGFIDHLLRHYKLNTPDNIITNYPLFFCAASAIKCGHGNCVTAINSDVPKCSCHYGWRGVNCNERYDPFGVANPELVQRFPSTPDYALSDSCDILLAEGCPDEEEENCTKLRPFTNWIECPRKLWLSTGNSWEEIYNMICHEGKFQTTPHGSDEKQALDQFSRVQCAHSQPKSNPTSFAPISLDSSPSQWKQHFCFHNSMQCKNGGHCVHAHHTRGKQPVATYCSCRSGFSGARCEIAKSELQAISSNPECSLPLIESCTIVNSECDRLIFDRKSLIVSCARTLWVSNVQAVFNEHTKTNSFTTKWTKIDQLQCKSNNWEISWKNAKGSQQNEKISLDRKVYCSTNQPDFDANAFWDHKGFFPTRANFASVKPAALAWCPHGTSMSGCAGYCVLNYEKSQFFKACACQFGKRGPNCDTLYDPFGIDPRNEKLGVGSLVAAPLPGAIRDKCNILDAEGCPDESIDKCTKLRYFDSGVHCAKQLWVSHGKDWKKIDRVVCVDSGIDESTVAEDWNRHQWEIHWSDVQQRKEMLRSHNSFDYKRVQCKDVKPRTPMKLIGDFYCAYNRGTCAHESQCNLHFASLAKKYECVCSCSTGYGGARCDQPKDINVDAAPETGRNEIRIEVCEPSNLEDGCRNDQCKKLKANATHVICDEQLWLNYGEADDWLLDWHDISGVKCVNNVWRSECSRMIGQRQLVCSSARPSSISHSVWLTLLVSSIVLILVIFMTCSLCVLCYRKYRVAQRSGAKSATAHSPYCASSSTKQSDMTETTRED